MVATHHDMSARSLIVLSTAVLTGLLVGSGLAQWLPPRLEGSEPLPLAQLTLEPRDAPDELLGHLFAPSDPPPPVPDGPVEMGAPCDVPWRLVGTMMDRDQPSRSFAAIHTPEGSRLLATSMTYTELTVVELDAETVTLERGDGRRCEIRMFSSNVSSATIQTLAPVPAPPSDPRVRRVSSNHVEVDPSLLTSPGVLGVNALPVMRDGALAGVRLMGVRRSSPLAAAGVQNGDIISAVDGQVLRSPDVALGALGRLQAGQSVRVTLESRGRAREMTLSTAPRR